MIKTETAPANAEETRFVEMVFPEQANHFTARCLPAMRLSLMGKAAFVAATRHARCAMVMKSSDKVDFRSPIRVGQIVEVTAKVERVGRSSLTVGVDVVAEELISGLRRLAVRGSFDMVAVDAAGKAIPIPAASPPPATQEI